MIICPFCRREITDAPADEEFFCMYCGNKIVKSRLSPAEIIEESKPEPIKEVTANKIYSDEPVTFGPDLANMVPTLPVAVTPVAACAFSGVLLATRFVLPMFISDERVINFFYIIGFSGLVCSASGGIDEYSKRLNQKYLLLMEQIFIDIKYNDFVSAREKIRMIKPRFGMNHSCKVRWGTARSLLNMIADRFESRIRIPETGNKRMVKCPYCHKPIDFVPEAYFFCTHCKSTITNEAHKDPLTGTENYYWPAEYGSEKIALRKKILANTAKIGAMFISAMVFSAGVPIILKKPGLALGLMVAGGVGFGLSIAHDPDYKFLKFGFGASGIERLNSRIINYMMDGDFTSAYDFIEALNIFASAADDNLIRVKTTKYLLGKLANRLDDSDTSDRKEST